MLQWVMHLSGVFSEAVGMATQMRQMHLTRSHILHDLSDSELTERYPDDLAKLLIHLGRTDTEPWFWLGTRKVIDKLLAIGLPDALEQGLGELIVKHNLSWGSVTTIATFVMAMPT